MGSRSELGLAQSWPQWCAIRHAQAAHRHPRRHGWHLLSAGTTACLQRLFRHFQPNVREKNFACESAAEAVQDPSLCAPLHTAPALEENLCPVHREPASLHSSFWTPSPSRCNRCWSQVRGSRPKGVRLLEIWPGAACGSPAGRRTQAGKSCKTAHVAMTLCALEEHISDPALIRRARAGVNTVSSSQRGLGTKGTWGQGSHSSRQDMPSALHNCMGGCNDAASWEH